MSQDSLEKLKAYLQTDAMKPSHKFIIEKAREYPPFTNFGLNQLPYALMPAVAICMEEYVEQQLSALQQENEKLRKEIFGLRQAHADNGYVTQIHPPSNQR